MYCILYRTALQLQFPQSHSVPAALRIRQGLYLPKTAVALVAVILSKSNNVFTQVARTIYTAHGADPL